MWCHHVTLSYWLLLAFLQASFFKKSCPCKLFHLTTEHLHKSLTWQHNVLFLRLIFWIPVIASQSIMLKILLVVVTQKMPGLKRKLHWREVPLPCPAISERLQRLVWNFQSRIRNACTVDLFIYLFFCRLSIATNLEILKDSLEVKCMDFFLPPVVYMENLHLD